MTIQNLVAELEHNVPDFLPNASAPDYLDEQDRNWYINVTPAGETDIIVNVLSAITQSLDDGEDFPVLEEKMEYRISPAPTKEETLKKFSEEIYALVDENSFYP